MNLREDLLRMIESPPEGADRVSIAIADRSLEIYPHSAIAIGEALLFMGRGTPGRRLYIVAPPDDPVSERFEGTCLKWAFDTRGSSSALPPHAGQRRSAAGASGMDPAAGPGSRRQLRARRPARDCRPGPPPRHGRQRFRGGARPAVHPRTRTNRADPRRGHGRRHLGGLPGGLALGLRRRRRSPQDPGRCRAHG